MSQRQFDFFDSGPEIPPTKLARPWVWYLEESRAIRIHLLATGKLYLEVVKSNPNTGRDRWLFDHEYENTSDGVAAMAKDMKRYDAELPDYRITEAERFRERHYTVGERLLIKERCNELIALYYLIGSRLVAPVWSEYEQFVFKPERDFGLDRYLDMPAVVHESRYIAERLLMKHSAGYRIVVITEDDAVTELLDKAGIKSFAEAMPSKSDDGEE